MIFRRLEDPDFVSHAPAVSGALFGRNAGIVREESADYEKEWESKGENLTETQKGEKWEQLLSDYMYRTYSSRLAPDTEWERKQGMVLQHGFGTAAHVLDQAAAFDGAWKEDRLFSGNPP